MSTCFCCEKPYDDCRCGEPKTPASEPSLTPNERAAMHEFVEHMRKEPAQPADNWTSELSDTGARFKRVDGPVLVGPAQPAEPAFDGCARCGSRYHLSAQCETPIERCGPDNYQNSKYVGELTAEIERLRADLADERNEHEETEAARAQLQAKLSASENQNQRLREMCKIEEVKRLRQERDAALAEVERLRDMLDDLQLPKVGREEPREET